MYSIVYYTIAIICLIKCVQKLIYQRCTSKVCLVGKTALITGGSKGIGLETSLGLAARGCRVIIGCRSDASQVKEEITRATHNPNIITKYLDLSSLASVRKFCKELSETEKKIDILINNAGIGADVNDLTEDGLNTIMQTNLFGPFLLTHLLLGLLKKSEHARIIFVSSLLSFLENLTLKNLNADSDKAIPPFWLYVNSKAAQIIVSNELAEKLKPFGITSNALHPGLVRTEIFDKLSTLKLLSPVRLKILYITNYLFAKTPEEGAQRSLSMAMSDSFKNVTGTFLWRFPITPKCAKDKEFRKTIWKQIEEYVGLKQEEKISN